jgi:hypothetical protein
MISCSRTNHKPIALALDPSTKSSGKPGDRRERCKSCSDILCYSCSEAVSHR